jgi:hypothetical protein
MSLLSEERAMASQNPSVTAPLGAAEETERRAFNRAFRELGLAWYWEVADYRELAGVGDAAARVRRYVETRQPALLAVYDAGFLASVVSEIAARMESGVAQASPARSGRGWTPGGHSVDFVA